MVRYVRLELTQPPRSDLREHLTLSGNRLPHHDVKGTYAISRDKQHRGGVDFIDVANLAPAKESEGQVGSLDWHQTRISSSDGDDEAPASKGPIVSARNSSTC